MKEENVYMERISYVDIGAGVMIIWLMYYHALYPMLGAETLAVIPYFFFFMPWFFYKSGYFFKTRPLTENVRKDAGKLLKQFTIWSAIGYVCYILHHTFFYHDLSWRVVFYTPLRSLLLGGSVPINNALWFLLTLFFVRQIATISLPKIHALYIGIASMVAACAIHFLDFRLMPGTIYTVFWGLCFFSAGYYLKNYEQNKWVIAVSVVVLLLTFTLTDIAEVYKKEETIEWYWYILWYPASIAACVVFNNLCRWVDGIGKKIFRNSRYDMPLPIIKWVGRHSMTFYVAHYIIFRIVFDLVAKYNETWYAGWQGLVIITIAYAMIIVPLCFILDKKKV